MRALDPASPLPLSGCSWSCLYRKLDSTIMVMNTAEGGPVSMVEARRTRMTRLVAALLFTAPGLKFRFLGPAAAAGGRGVYVSERW